MKLRDANLQVNEKNYFSHLPSCLPFLRILTANFPEEALKVSQHNFFQPGSISGK